MFKCGLNADFKALLQQANSFKQLIEANLKSPYNPEGLSEQDVQDYLKCFEIKP